MADTVRTLNVNTLEGGVLTVQVTASNTMEDLKEMLCQQKQCEDPIQRKILKAEVLVDGNVLHDGSQTLEAAGLLEAESEVSVVYSRNEVEVATKQAIYVEGFVQVNIPASVVAISARAFQTCYQVVKVEIPQSVTSIGHRAFERCSSLASITMPESVTAIEERVFEGCKSLARFTIPESVKGVGVGAFARCSSLESITIPKSVTAIGGQAFFECSSLVSITIRESVSSIGVHAFAACTSLESITIPESVRVIGHGAFEECTSLVRITIPRLVTAIEDSTFDGCVSLESITIPDSVRAIGRRAFAKCSSLENITIPESVSSIGHNAFVGIPWQFLRPFADDNVDRFGQKQPLKIPKDQLNEKLLTPYRRALKADVDRSICHSSGWMASSAAMELGGCSCRAHPTPCFRPLVYRDHGESPRRSLRRAVVTAFDLQIPLEQPYRTWGLHDAPLDFLLNFDISHTSGDPVERVLLLPPESLALYPLSWRTRQRLRRSKIRMIEVEQPKTCRYGNCKYTYHANIERTYFLPSWGKHPIFPTLAMAAATAKVTFLFFASAFLHEADAECPTIDEDALLQLTDGREHLGPPLSGNSSTAATEQHCAVLRQTYLESDLCGNRGEAPASGFLVTGTGRSGTKSPGDGNLRWTRVSGLRDRQMSYG
eukprot:symbB.v1.2.039027.t1/scaffold6302.1/size19189/1